MEVENEHCKKVEKEKHNKEDLERKEKNERTSVEVENEHFKKVQKEKDKIEDLEWKEKDKGEKDHHIGEGKKCVSGLVILLRGNLLESLSKHGEGKFDNVLANSLSKPPP